MTGICNSKPDVTPWEKHESQRAQRTGVLVVGMHRSGTSALTGALGALGLAMPKHPLGADDNNPTGHWEPEPLVRLHDRMLAEAGSRWDDWRSFDLLALGRDAVAQYKIEIAALIDQEFGDAPVFALKDPRLCRMVPLYEDVLYDLGIEPRYLLVYRSPQAVVASLAKRDQMTAGFAESVWLRHVLDAEAATRGRQRSIHSYEAFLANWRPAALRMAEELNLNWPRPINDAGFRVDRLLSQEFNHHPPAGSESTGPDVIMDLVNDTYESLLALSANESNAKARSVLDRVKGEFDSAVATLGGATFPELAAREKRLAGLADIRQYHIDRLTGEGVVKDRTIEALRDELASIKLGTSWRISRPLRAVVRILKNQQK